MPLMAISSDPVSELHLGVQPHENSAGQFPVAGLMLCTLLATRNHGVTATL
jgi:hypothetical protein